MQYEPRTIYQRGCSSDGRAGALQASGQEFDSPHLHHARSVAQSGSASALGAEGQKFESSHSDQEFASVAQMVEQLICNHQVVGSIPTAGTKARSSDGRALC